MECYYIQGPVCLVFGNAASLITIEIDCEWSATVSMVCQRSQTSGLLDPRERKLLRLALDRAAEPGEIRNAAVKLIESWRCRGVAVEHFDEKTATLTIESDYARKIIGFGRYCGERIIDLPHDYLRWIVETPGIQEKYPDVVEAAAAVLKRGVR
jgi:Putative quorum-sensing-regulated virulence factor